MNDFRSWVKERTVLMPDLRCRTAELYDDYMAHVGAATLLARVRAGLPGRRRFVGLLRLQCGCALMKSNGRSFAVGIALKPLGGV